MLNPRRARTLKCNPRTARAYLARSQLTSSRLWRPSGRRSVRWANTVCVVSWGQIKSRVVAAELACGVAAGPLFVTSFTAIGARRSGYDWRRHAVSSLAAAPGGWLQRANFMVTGSLFCVAAHGLARGSKEAAGPRAVPALTFAVGGGLIGSGLFVTDPVAGYPPSPSGQARADRTPAAVPTREGTLHNLCAIPIFVGIPIVALTSATSSARRGQHRWASYSAGSAIAMGSASALFGAAFGGAPRLARHGGVLPARVDHNRLRMAKRTIASSVDFSSPDFVAAVI